MSRGFIALHRKVFENKLYFAEPFTRIQAWIDLLLLANHKNATITIRQQLVHIKRGQIGWTKSNLSKRWRWSRGKVNRFLKYLESEQQIVQQQSQPTTVLTIVNYERYQYGDTEVDHEDDTADSKANGTQTISSNNANNNFLEKKRSTATRPNEELTAIPTELLQALTLGGWQHPPLTLHRWLQKYPQAQISKAFEIGVKRCGYNPPVAYVKKVLENSQKRGHYEHQQQNRKAYPRQTPERTQNRKTSKFSGHPAGASP